MAKGGKQKVKGSKLHRPKNGVNKLGKKDRKSNAKKAKVLIDKMDKQADELYILRQVTTKETKPKASAFSTLQKDKKEDEQAANKAAQTKKDVNREATMLETLLAIDD